MSGDILMPVSTAAAETGSAAVEVAVVTDIALATTATKTAVQVAASPAVALAAEGNLDTLGHVYACAVHTLAPAVNDDDFEV